ncbi:hypothetical protein [Bordetella sp. 02P26C-1]|uniref:hypothetical protein n=1 Tax=Bordetella sp. 02P26C-1 TaxID=2683195 RepID=UPI001921C9FB|nr:hypothetical protein [Bordetella sp. 02P26C-1]
MANEWLRLWHDMPNDPKWRTVARVSAQPIALVQAVYMHLLVDASRSVTRGHVTVTTEDLASALDVTEDAIEAILAAMQGRVLDGQYLSGWDKRQPKREDTGSEKTGAKSAVQRKRDQRERERSAAQLDESRQCHDESREVTLDKDKEEDKEEKNTPLTPRKRGSAFDASTIDLPDWLDQEDWQCWVSERRARKKPITEEGARRQLQQLAQYRTEGHRPADVIANSIAGGYQGLFPPRTQPRARSPSRAQMMADWNAELGEVLAEGRRATVIDMGTIDATH